jgi:hypothetical protein
MKLQINSNFINCFKKLFKIYIEEWNWEKNQFKKFTKKTNTKWQIKIHEITEFTFKTNTKNFYRK